MHDLYRVLLTEDGYTTVSEPTTKSAATADFDHYAPHGTPFSRSYLRVVTEDEYQRLRPALESTNQVRTSVSTSGVVRD
jgi:hypothetical protein